jgi:crotonobetainyl-CoA:carnitine CoA-transferase CaiB-like acyl-CoA transferase
MLGEHTNEVLGEFLGLGADDILDLKDRGVI